MSKSNPDKFYGKFSHLYEKKDYTGALKLLETVPPAHKKKKEYHFGKAVCYYLLDEDKKALTHLNKISSKFRKDPDYQYLKAECHSYLGRDKDLDPAIHAYSNTIELYESDPKSLEWFDEKHMTISRSKILSCLALKGERELDENNLKSVQESLDYIMEHHSDCTDENSFGLTGLFLLYCSLSDEFSDREEDYIDLSIASFEKAIKKCRKNSQDLPFYENMLGYAYSLSGMNAMEKGDKSSIKKMSEKIIGMDLTLSDEYEAYLHIGIFLGSCYNIKDFLETDEQYLLNAQIFLFECQKSDVKDIKNISKLMLGILNSDNLDGFNDYTRGLEFDNEFWNDIYIFEQTSHNLDKKPRSAIRALNSLKERKNIHELEINLYLALAYWEAKQKNKAKKLLTEIKREDFSNYFHVLPYFDLLCSVILNSSEAKVHLEELVERYPDSERFKEFLESAEKENLDAIKGELIEILIPNSFNNYSIITSNKIKVPSYTIDHGSPIKLKDRSKQPGENGKPKKQKPPQLELKNHLILIPKYRTGNIHQNIIQYYDKKGQSQVDEIFQDDMFDFIYYIMWLQDQGYKPLSFRTIVSSNHREKILGKEDPSEIKRFENYWAITKDSDTKRRRCSAVNKKLGYDLILYKNQTYQLRKDIIPDLIPFPDY